MCKIVLAFWRAQVHVDWPAILPSSKEVKGKQGLWKRACEQWGVIGSSIHFLHAALQGSCGWIGKPLLSHPLSMSCCSSTKDGSWLSRTFPILWIVAFELKLEYRHQKYTITFSFLLVCLYNSKILWKYCHAWVTLILILLLLCGNEEI